MTNIERLSLLLVTMDKQMTAEPWHTDRDHREEVFHDATPNGPSLGRIWPVFECSGNGCRDTQPIAALRNALPGLIEMAEDWRTYVDSASHIAPIYVAREWEAKAERIAQRIIAAIREAYGDGWDALCAAAGVAE